MAIFGFFLTIAETTWECGFQLAPPSLELLGITSGFEILSMPCSVYISGIVAVVWGFEPVIWSFL